MKVKKELKKRLINKLLNATGEATQTGLIKKYSISNLSRIKTTKQMKRLINQVILKYCLRHVDIWELARIAKNYPNCVKIKEDNIHFRKKIRELEEKIKKIEKNNKK